MKSLSGVFICVCLVIGWVLIEDVEASVDYSCLHSSAWKLNTGHMSPYFGNALTDVTSSSLVNGQWKVVSNGIPKYEHTMSATEIASLNARPKKSSDFVGGQINAVADTTYSFGANVGYTTQSCSLGYWPPGPGCPTASSATTNFDLTPSPETRSGGCYIPMLGTMGKFANGVSIFGWSDGVSYNNQDVWHNNAPAMEAYDLDVCNGHAANGDYHHHHYPNCLREALGDSGAGHSPIYGWGSDSYPLTGPFQAAGVLAKSCWQRRNYDSSSPTGCSTGTRCCTLNNPEDYRQGTTSQSGKCGPSLTGTVTTQSGNTISAASGIYFEDYFYNASCFAMGGEYLDSHNGHSHGPYGYHYHVTVDTEGNAQFPYMIGPKFYGCRSSTCCTSATSRNCGTGSTCGISDGSGVNSCGGSVANPTAFPTMSAFSPTATPTSSPYTPTALPTLFPNMGSAPPTSPVNLVPANLVRSGYVEQRMYFGDCSDMQSDIRESFVSQLAVCGRGFASNDVRGEFQLQTYKRSNVVDIIGQGFSDQKCNKKRGKGKTLSRVTSNTCLAAAPNSNQNSFQKVVYSKKYQEIRAPGLLVYQYADTKCAKSKQSILFVAPFVCTNHVITDNPSAQSMVNYGDYGFVYEFSEPNCVGNSTYVNLPTPSGKQCWRFGAYSLSFKLNPAPVQGN